MARGGMGWCPPGGLKDKEHRAGGMGTSGVEGGGESHGTADMLRVPC
jgi:hypothetical protein